MSNFKEGHTDGTRTMARQIGYMIEVEKKSTDYILEYVTNIIKKTEKK